MESAHQQSSRLIGTFIFKVVVDFSESPPNPMLVVSLSVKYTNKKFKTLLFFRVFWFLPDEYEERNVMENFLVDILAEEILYSNCVTTCVTTIA